MKEIYYCSEESEQFIKCFDEKIPDEVAEDKVENCVIQELKFGNVKNFTKNLSEVVEAQQVR